MRSCDAIIIGGGTNGLAAAGRLAKAGRKVTVLESAAAAGGGARAYEFVPGYRASVAHLLNMLDPRVEAGLNLAGHGLTYAARDLATTALSATGDHLVLEGAYGEKLSGAVCEAERTAWAGLRAKLLRLAGALRPFKAMTPPRLARNAGNDFVTLARLAVRARMLGRDDIRELLRMLLINVADVLDEDLQDDRLKGVLAFDAVLGAHLGPRSPNSLILLLNRLASEASGITAGLALPKGGIAAVGNAMMQAVQALGAEIRMGSRATAIEIDDGRAKAVVLKDGTRLVADIIVSAANPKTTLLDLVGPRHLDTGIVRRTGNIRMRGDAAKLHLALKAAPDFRGADPASRLVIAPSVRAVEDAFNPVKYGTFSESPVMEIVLPSMHDDGHAPDGHHVLSAVVQYVPYDLREGRDKGRADLQDRIMGVLETYAPGIGALVIGSELLTPLDLEQNFGFVGGNWHHGELAVERMFFLRPMIGAAQYKSPIDGLYLAGAGCHPGGGISGAAGWNAAERILAAEGA